MTERSRPAKTNLASDEETQAKENSLRNDIEMTLTAIGVPLENQLHIARQIVEDLEFQQAFG